MPLGHHDGNAGSAEGASIRIVISYRRRDSAGHAGRLYSDLAERFGEDHVFMDIDAIPPSADFTEVIADAIEGCDAFIAVIGSRWLTETDKEGRRRIDNPTDLVRAEIEAALSRRRVKIFPVLVDGAQMPSADELPPSLARFVTKNAFELSDRRWPSDVRDLVEVLEATAREKAEQLGGQPAEERPREEQARRPARTQWLRRRAAVLVAAAVALLVVGVAVWALVRALSDSDRQTISETVVSVPGKPDWTDTGIDVEDGQRISITAEGRVDTNVDEVGRDCGPDGLPNEQNAPANVVAAANHGALIGRIGDGTPFAVGASDERAATTSGRLYLGVNDTGYQNNGDAYQATVTVSTG